MKDLGELLGLNLDSNQKHVKDHTKPMVTDGGISPEEASKSGSSKAKKVELKGPKKPTGKVKRFNKIKNGLKLNVEKIPGSK